ncbi:MAG: hypothetical protein V3T39_03710 [Gammaproteobacteria bacterium]
MSSYRSSQRQFSQPVFLPALVQKTVFFIGFSGGRSTNEIDSVALINTLSQVGNLGFSLLVRL